MTSAGDAPILPQTISAAMAERQVLSDQIRTATLEINIRRQELRDRGVPMMKRWEQTRPHMADKEAEFVALQRRCIDLANALADSFRKSSEEMKALPASRTSFQFIRNHATRAKALNHEQLVVGALRLQLSQGIEKRKSILDDLENVTMKIEELVRADASP